MDAFASRAGAREQGALLHALLHVGDAIYDSGGGGDPVFFSERIARPYLSPLRARSFLVALGNHDTNYEDNGAALLSFSNLTARFYERVFTGSDGATMQLIVLDSNCLAYAKRADAALAAQQAAFLAAKLSEGSFTWRAVALHHPVHSCARHRSTPRCAPSNRRQSLDAAPHLFFVSMTLVQRAAAVDAHHRAARKRGSRALRPRPQVPLLPPPPPPSSPSSSSPSSPPPPPPPLPPSSLFARRLASCS
jgi:hypothetical protein